jgi:hypothetical protein
MSTLSGYSSNNQTVIPDTSILRYGFITLDDDGEVLSTTTLERIMIDLSPTTVTEGVLDMANHPDGGWYFLSDCNTPESLELYRMSTGGEVMWAKSIGVPSSSTMFPTWGETGLVPYLYSTHLFATSSGDALIVSMADQPQGALKVKRIASDGTIEMVRSYTLLNPTSNGNLLAAELDAEDNLHAVVRIGYPTSVLLVYKIAADGTLLTVETVFDSAMGYDLLVGTSGERYLGGLPAPDWPQTLTELSTGPMAHVTTHTGIPQPQYTYTLIFQKWNLKDGWFRVACDLHKEDNILGTAIEYPMVWKLPTETYEPCSSYSWDTDLISVSLDNFSVTDDPEIVAVDITDQVHAFASTATSSEITPDPMNDMCDLLVGITDHEASKKAHLASDLVLAGEPLVVLDNDAAFLEVRAMDGHLVHTPMRLGAVCSLPTTGYAPGLYVVRAMDKQARQLWCEAVVVQ